MNVRKQKRRAAALARFRLRSQGIKWTRHPVLLENVSVNFDESDADYAAYLKRKKIEKDALTGPLGRKKWQPTQDDVAAQQDAEADAESAECYAEEAAYYAELEQGYAQDRI